jgi:hypothetical protein
MGIVFYLICVTVKDLARITTEIDVLQMCTEWVVYDLTSDQK